MLALEDPVGSEETKADVRLLLPGIIISICRSAKHGLSKEEILIHAHADLMP